MNIATLNLALINIMAENPESIIEKLDLKGNGINSVYYESTVHIH